MTELALGYEEVYGDYPAGIEAIGGNIKIDGVPNPINLREKAEEYLNGKPEVVRGAKRLKKDIVALASCHGREILVGVGVASMVTAGAIVLYRRGRKLRIKSSSENIS